jgi:hypothetical protein
LQSQPPYKGKIFITKIEKCGGWQGWHMGEGGLKER